MARHDTETMRGDLERLSGDCVNYPEDMRLADVVRACCFIAHSVDMLVARTTPLEALRGAVNKFCSCGGSGPNDDGCCPACHVWHELHGVL